MADYPKGKASGSNGFLGKSGFPLMFHFSEKSHLVDFMMGGTAAAISKTVAAPIERVKLMIQNQGAMIAAGRLSSPYRGVVDCFRRTYVEEGLLSCARLHFSTNNPTCSAC